MELLTSSKHFEGHHHLSRTIKRGLRAIRSKSYNNSTVSIMVQPEKLPSLAKLPDEILAFIFQHLDAKSLVSVGATARRFWSISNEELLWKGFCRDDFRYWDNRRAFRQLLNDGSYHEWKTLYYQRQQVARKTQHRLDEIIQDSRGRSDRIQDIVDLGYDAKETLLRAFKESASSPDHLAQRYWSHVALGCLHRSVALKLWKDIRLGNVHDNTTERGLAAFDMFILDQQDNGDVDDILDGLDHYVQQVRAAFPNLDQESPRTKAMTIASYLRERRWIGIDSSREYHSLDNMFLGVALSSSHNNSLPLISSVIYSYIARQFGLRAQPISYPMHVHVLVQPTSDIDLDGNPLDLSTIPDPREPSPRTHLYMDPFNGVEPIPISTLQTQLRFIVPTATAAQTQNYLSAASHRDLIVRAAYNILNTRTLDNQPITHPITPSSAIYAAFFALVLYPNHPATLRTHLSELTQHFLHHNPADIHTFREHILPLTQNLPDHLAYRNLFLQLQQNDIKAPTPKLRFPQPNSIKYRVGQIFRHKRRNYTGIIYGWDASCDMSQQWITMNQVDRLSGGRQQPFYNVFVVDDGSTRYVAEENIEAFGPEEEGGNGRSVSMEQVLEWPIEIGKWMKRLDVDDDGFGYSFISNIEDQYPED